MVPYIARVLPLSLLSSIPILHVIAATSMTAAGGFPVADLKSVPAHTNITLGQNGTHIATKQQLTNATLILCSSVDCIAALGECQLFNLDDPSLRLGMCVSTLPFMSVMIDQFSGTGLPFAVLIGPPGCEELDKVAAVNQCFNLRVLFGEFLLAD